MANSKTPKVGELWAKTQAGKTHKRAYILCEVNAVDRDHVYMVWPDGKERRQSLRTFRQGHWHREEKVTKSREYWRKDPTLIYRVDG